MTVLPRPTQAIPLPATDATVSSGLPDARLSTRLDPSTAITQGVQGGRKLSARVMNWILGGFGDWINYLTSASDDTISRVTNLEGCRQTVTVVPTLAALQAVAGVSSGDEIYVQHVGNFTYQGTTIAVKAPWGYTATDMGTGVWLSDAANVLLSTPTDQTVNPLLVNQNLRAFGGVTPSSITYTTTSATPSVAASAVVPVTGFGGSTLRVMVSGLLAAVTGGSGAVVDVLLTFNDSGTTTHTAGQIGIPAGVTTCVALGYDFPIPSGATACTVAVRGSTSGGSLTSSGFASTQWLQWSVLQIAA